MVFWIVISMVVVAAIILFIISCHKEAKRINEERKQKRIFNEKMKNIAYAKDRDIVNSRLNSFVGIITSKGQYINNINKVHRKKK